MRGLDNELSYAEIGSGSAVIDRWLREHQRNRNLMATIPP